MRLKNHLPQIHHTALHGALSLVCLLSLGALRSTPAQGFDSIERARMHDILKTLKNDIKNNYYDTSFHGIDLEARFKAADEKLKQATTLGQALGIIAQAVIDLNDSHTFFLPPDRPERVDYGWRMLMIGDKCYVTAVRPGSDAEAKGLKPGDLIESVNGFKPSRKEYWKMQYYYNMLSPQLGLHVVAQSPDGQSRPLDIAAKVRKGRRVLSLERSWDIWDMVKDGEHAAHINRDRFKELGGTLVWKMPGFDIDPGDAAMSMERAKKFNTLILDLRGNPGGYEETLKRMLGYFFDHDIKVADLKGRKEMKPLVAKTQGNAIFKGKLIVLIDSESASCSELFSRVIQMEKRGIVIGDRSAGAVMQAMDYGHSIGTDRIVMYAASITSADVIMTDGQSLENLGVTPDELKIPAGKDLAAKEDTVLAYALRLAGENISPAQAGALFPLEWLPL